jgi:hypothetical protein
MMDSESNTCVGCGGDGKYRNAFGNICACPFCHGSRHKGSEQGLGLKDVTRTKERKPNIQAKPVRATNAFSEFGIQLWNNIEIALTSKRISEAKARELKDRIIGFEETKGRVTSTEKVKITKLLK